MFWEPSQQTLEKRRKAWLRTNARGKRRYVFVRGVLGWGLTMCVSMTLIQGLLQHDSFWFRPWVILFNLLLWSLGGYFWGVYMWDYGQNFIDSGKGLP